jgi:hypothetical protein
MCADASFSCFAFGPLDGLFFPAAVSKLHAYQASKTKGAKNVKHKNKDATVARIKIIFFQHIWCQ